MEQVEVCNSWEEFEDNSKLLDQQLEKLKLQKGRKSVTESESQSSSSATPEAPPKMRVLKRNVALPVDSTEVKPNGGVEVSTNGVLKPTVMQEESSRTQYVPPEPRISILSRPKKNTSEDISNSNGKSKNQPVKSLEQREQEYAEARRRIFGDVTETES